MHWKYISLIVLGASGCSSTLSTRVHPNLTPQADTATTPTVAFIGDQLTYSALTPAVLAAHPLWINAATNGPETSAAMLARFDHDVLQRKPDVVVIWPGEGDLLTYPDWSGENQCGAYTDAKGVQGTTCANWEQMAQMAQAAGVRCLIGDLSEYAAMPDPNDSPIEVFGYNQQLNKSFTQYGGQYGSQLIAYSTLLAGDQYFTDAGMQVSDAGSQVIVQNVEQIVSAMNVGAVR